MLAPNHRIEDQYVSPGGPMSVSAIVSYDDTLNDQDALALARLLSDAGAELTLAYVRHATQSERALEEHEEHETEALLARGARWLGDLDVERRVLLHASTGEGLRALAQEEDHSLIVFGSDYRTAAGHVAPQRSTQRLLEGGPTAIAIAPAGYSAAPAPEIRRIGLLAGLDDSAAIDTAHQLATHFGATVTDSAHGVELLIVGSRPEARAGQVMVSAQAQNAIENATAPVLIVARGVALDFRSSIYVS
jgi:nucleotide-binding universal stress UspA family protein